MSKGINQVRKSIQQRKRKRVILPKEQNKQDERIIRLPNDEEKHGFISEFVASPTTKKKSNTRIPMIAMKAMISISLFFVLAIIMESNSSFLHSVKNWTSQALTEDFPFATVHAWYSDTFGSPLGFEPKLPVSQAEDQPFQLPVSGQVTEPFQANGVGIHITPEQTENIYAWEEGIVVFVGTKKDTETTVIVQHADGGKTTYGNLSSTDVHFYQHVSKNEQIGSFDTTDEANSVFFSLEQDRTFIDPIQVIQVYDQL